MIIKLPHITKIIPFFFSLEKMTTTNIGAITVNIGCHSAFEDSAVVYQPGYVSPFIVQLYNARLVVQTLYYPDWLGSSNKRKEGITLQTAHLSV